jgi:hypothetical protein
MKRRAARVKHRKYTQLQSRRRLETQCDRWLGNCNSFLGDLSVEVCKW